MKNSSALRPNAVFLNLPFEKSYEEIFVGYLVGLITMGLEPHCVVELHEDGEGRMARLFKLMSRCGASIHDLSYAGEGKRYNMPFELGIAYALSRLSGKRRLVVVEARKRALLKTLTDLRGFDPKVHQMKGRKAMDLVYEYFISPSIAEAEETGHRIYPQIIENLREFRGGHSTIFNRKSFQYLVWVIASVPVVSP